MDNGLNQSLIKIAKDAMSKSYSPYSNFKVGAALLDEVGGIYMGANVENASYGGTICAERVAAVRAIMGGARKFKKIAIVSSSGEYTYPCGICLQFLSEFMDDGIVVLYNENKGIKEVKFEALFPNAFKLNE